MSLSVGVLGAGSWGTTVASLIANNTPTQIWGRNADTVREINEQQSNESYLPGIKLSKNLRAVEEISDVIRTADLIVMGVPSKAFRETLIHVKENIRPWVPIISLAKGFELETKYRMTQVVKEILPDHPCGVLTGPNLAREIAAGQAAASVLAMEEANMLGRLQPIFHNGLFRVYTNTDLVGCELGGALKNVIAIAAGMGDGAGAGDNTRSAVITRGLAEMTRLGVAMGGRPETFAGLAGMGDMLATCTSSLSRNHHVGEQLGKGRKLNDIIAEMNMVAEGVKSSKAVMEIAEELDVDMPIAREVYKVCHEGSTARRAFRGLLRQEIRSEADPG